jgi:hypothetical protein
VLCEKRDTVLDIRRECIMGHTAARQERRNVFAGLALAVAVLAMGGFASAGFGQ